MGVKKKDLQKLANECMELETELQFIKAAEARASRFRAGGKATSRGTSGGSQTLTPKPSAFPNKPPNAFARKELTPKQSALKAEGKCFRCKNQDTSHLTARTRRKKIIRWEKSKT